MPSRRPSRTCKSRSSAGHRTTCTRSLTFFTSSTMSSWRKSTSRCCSRLSGTTSGSRSSCRSSSWTNWTASRTAAPSPHAKWRAAYTLGVFDRIFPKRGAQGILHHPAAEPHARRSPRRPPLRPAAAPSGCPSQTTRSSTGHSPPRASTGTDVTLADLRHQPGRQGTQRRAGREEAHQATRRGTPGHAGRKRSTPTSPTVTRGEQARTISPRPTRQATLMSNTPAPPSLQILLERVTSEREAMNSYADGIDGKAGVLLGFAGVLIGLGATAQAPIATQGIFQAGLAFAGIAAGLAASVILPQRSPVLEVLPLRQMLLMASESETQLQLLDTQIQMVIEVRQQVKRKGQRLNLSVISLAIAAILVVIGTLTTGGQTNAGNPAKPQPTSSPSPGRTDSCSSDRTDSCSPGHTRPTSPGPG